MLKVAAVELRDGRCEDSRREELEDALRLGFGECFGSANGLKGRSREWNVDGSEEVSPALRWSVEETQQRSQLVLVERRVDGIREVDTVIALPTSAPSTACRIRWLTLVAGRPRRLATVASCVDHLLSFCPTSMNYHDF